TRRHVNVRGSRRAAGLHWTSRTTTRGGAALTAPCMRPANAASRGRRRGLVLGAAWAVSVLVLWLGIFVPSMRADAPAGIGIDLRGYFLPKYVYGSMDLARGALPLWNSFESAGLPFLGVAQPAALYPPRVVLFALLPPTLALHVFMIVHYLALGAGAYVALRALRLEWPGAALGAIVVAFQPFMLHGHYAPHWISNFVWFPLVLAAFVRTVEQPTTPAALALAIATAFLILAGYPEYAFDTALVLALLWPFVVAHAPAAAARGTALALAAAGAGVLLAAVQWVPTIEAVRESVR